MPPHQPLALGSLLPGATRSSDEGDDIEGPPTSIRQILGLWLVHAPKKCINPTKVWARRARRDLSDGGVYLEAQVSWRAQRREFRVCWGRHLLPAQPDFGPGRPSSRLDDTWCPPTITEHFATISSCCGGARTRSAVVMSSALAEQPPGELLAAHGAAVRPWKTCRRLFEAAGPIPAKGGTRW